MLRLAWKAVKHNPKRLILTSISVMLGVGLVVTIHCFTAAIDRQFTEMIDEIYSGSDITVGQEGSFNFDSTSGNPFPSSLLDDVRQIDGVADAVGGVGGIVTILTPDGELPPQTGAPNLFFNWQDDPELGLMSLVDGRAVASSGEVTVDANGLDRLHYAIGDTLLVATDTGINRYEIVGSTWFGKTNDLSGAILLQFTLDDARALADIGDEYQELRIKVTDGANIDTVAADIQKILPDDIVAISNADIIADQQESVREGLRYVDIFTLVFALISVFVGGFIIANTFRIIVTQRTREIGLVRALGARASQVRKQILLEAFIVATVASALGIAVGYLLAFGLIQLVNGAGMGIDLGVAHLPLAAILWGLGVGYFVTLVSVILPAVHASGISPMEALREAGTASHKPLRLRNAVGGGMSVVALGLVFTGLYATVDQPGIWVGVGAALLVLGVALLSAQLLTWIADGLRGAVGRVFGVNGRLALGNVKREPRRAGVTATALMIGVLLLSLVATLTETFKVTAREQMENQVVADVIVSGDMLSGAMTDVSPTAQEAVANTPGVALISVTQFGFVTVDGQDVFLGGIDPATTDETYVRPTTPGIDQLDDGVYVAPRIEALGYHPGDRITIEGVDSTLTLRVTGTYDLEGDFDLLVSGNTARELDGDIVNYMLLANIDPGADLPTVVAAIETNLEEFPLLEVTEPDALVKQMNDFFNAMLLIITVMLSASLLIAVLGVANTLFLSVTERTREIGLLRAVGVRRRSIWVMITLESVAIAVFGALVGMALGVGLGAALVTALASFGFSAPVIPTMWLIVYAILAIAAGIVAALVPAWRASKVNIIEAVTTE